MNEPAHVGRHSHEGTGWTGYEIDRAVALAMTQTNVWVGDPDGSIYRIDLGGAAGVEPDDLAMCNTSRLSGDLDGDGQDDILSIAAMPSRAACRARSRLEDWILTVMWSQGTTSSWPLPRCDTIQPNGQGTPTRNV